jgi:periplasmic copper chaperone A
MRRIFLEIAVAALLTIAAAVLLAIEAIASDVMVMDAYARASATSAAKSGAAYLTMMNHGNTADRLIGLSADIAESAQIHENVETNGMVSMQPVGTLDIPAGSEVELAPGGLHIMLFGLRKPLKKGGHFTLTLTFERSGAVVVDVPVGDVAQDGMDHSGHSSGSGN